MTDQKERLAWQSSTNPTIPLARPLAASASYTSDSQSETFVYDELGNRVTLNNRAGSDVLYANNEANEYTSIGGASVLYDAASEADCYYTLKDLYSVDGLVNNRGHEVERVTYDAYGMPLMKSIHVADVDYSGTVNATDTAAVVANYGLSVGTVGPAGTRAGFDRASGGTRRFRHRPSAPPPGRISRNWAARLALIHGGRRITICRCNLGSHSDLTVAPFSREADPCTPSDRQALGSVATRETGSVVTRETGSVATLETGSVVTRESVSATRRDFRSFSGCWWWPRPLRRSAPPRAGPLAWISGATPWPTRRIAW
jgi:hypothetical protein